MSLYLGKDAMNNNVLHITKDITAVDSLKNGFIPDSTIFLSSKSLFEVVYIKSISVPTATSNRYGFSAIEQQLSLYLHNTSYAVFTYVVDSSNNANPAFYSDVFYFGWDGGSLEVVNTSVSNNGKTLLFIVTKTANPEVSGEIFLSKEAINVGAANLLAKKFLAFSTNLPLTATAYNIGGAGFMYIVDAINAESFMFSKNAIQFLKAGEIYDFISIEASSRVHSYHSSDVLGTVGTHYYNGVSYDGPICKHFLQDVTNSMHQQIHVEFTYPFYYAEGWSGNGSTSSFNINVTFSSNVSKLLGFTLTPWLGFIIEWDHNTKMFYYGAHRYTYDIELVYTGSSVPSLLLKAV